MSTDYLLKDEIDDEPNEIVADESYGEIKKETFREITLEEANGYMDLMKEQSVKIAAAVLACIISPITLILLGGLSEYGTIGLSEDAAGGIGVIILLLIIAGAVCVFITSGMKSEKYKYLEEEFISLQYGVAGIVEYKREKFEPVYRKCTVIGVVICIISVIPLLFAGVINASDLICIYCVCILLSMISVAVFMFVWSGIIWGSYQKLLEDGDFSRKKKEENKKNDVIGQIYWCIATAIYLGISLYTRRWDITWILWPCAGVLFAAICGIVAVVNHKES